MTRDEAVKIAVNNKLSIHYHSFINTLEALGLLKFDEVATPKQEARKPRANDLISIYPNSSSYIVSNLLKHNYKIVDCDVYDIVDKRSNGNLKEDINNASIDIRAAESPYALSLAIKKMKTALFKLDIESGWE